MALEQYPIGLPAVIEKITKKLAVPALGNRYLAAIKKKLDPRELSPTANKEQVIQAISGIQDIKRTIADDSTRALVQEFIVNPLLTTIGRQTQPVQENKEIGNEQAQNLYTQQKYEEKSIRGMKQFAPKQRPGGINNRGLIYAALDNIIIKLASLSQPLGIRPDYGTTGDVSERLKKIKEQLKGATMLKMVPPMQDEPQVGDEPSESPCIQDYDEQPQETPECPCQIQDYDEDPQTSAGPKIIVLKIVDQDEPIEAPGAPEEPKIIQIDKEAHCMDRKFKTIQGLLDKTDLTAAQIKTIRKNLDDIYRKYLKLEKLSEKD
jgi:hypothetical protein